MKRGTIIICILLCMGLAGCRNNSGAALSETVQRVNNGYTNLETLQERDEVIMESMANQEYDSLDDFLKSNNESVVALNLQTSSMGIASDSNATSFSAKDTNVSVSDSFVFVTYECTSGDDIFKVVLATCKYENGLEQLNYVIDTNPGVFSKEDLGGVTVYYGPGSEYDWFDSYTMIINDKIFIIDIEKDYTQHIEEVLANAIYKAR